jgi:hypothetical protein
MSSGDWMKSYGFVVAMGHGLAGYGVVVTAAFFWGAHAALFALIALVPVALVKEYVIDLKVESDETAKSSTIDFLEYMAGALLGLTVTNIHGLLT